MQSSMSISTLTYETFLGFFENEVLACGLLALVEQPDEPEVLATVKF